MSRLAKVKVETTTVHFVRPLLGFNDDTLNSLSTTPTTRGSHCRSLTQNSRRSYRRPGCSVH